MIEYGPETPINEIDETWIRELRNLGLCPSCEQPPRYSEIAGAEEAAVLLATGLCHDCQGHLRLAELLSASDGEAMAAIFDTAAQTCRVCGCSQSDPCPGGCGWAAPGLCTRCTS